MTGQVLDDSKARAFVKITVPKSMRISKFVPETERIGFNSPQNARAAVKCFLKAGIQAKME